MLSITSTTALGEKKKKKTHKNLHQG